MINFYNSRQNNNYFNPVNLSLKNIDLKQKLTALLNVAIFITGTISNVYFAFIALGYISTMLLVYLLGSRIKDAFINVGYIWVSKWAVFIVFLMLSGIFLPDVFLYSLAMFLVFNLSVNPASIMSYSGAKH